MNHEIEQLLNEIREAIDGALAESLPLEKAMQELERRGVSPSLSVDVMLGEARPSPSMEFVTFDEGLILTTSDEVFLRSLGIVTAAP